MDGYRGFYLIPIRRKDMSILALSCNDVKLEAIQQENSIWLGATQIGLALGYANPETAITKLYNRNSDEFRNDMTKLVETNTSGGLQKIRIFSLRGCHLIAMFARTNVAKQFRKWVLDILDKEVGTPTAKTHKSEREPLTNAVNMLVAKTKHLNYSDAYKLVHQRFNVDHIEDIPYDAIPLAVEYVHHLIALFGNKENKNNDLYISGLAQAMIWVNHWWKEYGEGIRILNPNIANSVHDYFVDGSIAAWQFVGETEKVTLKNQLLSHQWNLTASERFKLV